MLLCFVGTPHLLSWPHSYLLAYMYLLCSPRYLFWREKKGFLMEMVQQLGVGEPTPVENAFLHNTKNYKFFFMIYINNK